jgi:hypothetical protein
MMISSVREWPAKMAIVDHHPVHSCAHFFVCARVSVKFSQTLVGTLCQIDCEMISEHGEFCTNDRDHG